MTTVEIVDERNGPGSDRDQPAQCFQVCFSIQTFVEIDTSNARNFVILPVFLVI